MTVEVQTFLKKIENDPALQKGVIALLDAARPERKRPYMPYQEFLGWADEDTLAEWVDGEIIMSSPASLRHQQIGLFLARILGSYAETKSLGEVLVAPFQMKLEHSGREPDLIFLKQEHQDRLKPTYLDGPADLVIEIISPESLERDRGTKFVEYELGGVPEYWLIDPIREWTECYQLNHEGRYDTRFAGHDGKCHSTMLPDFWLDIAWLWQTPLPAVLGVLQKLHII